MLTRQSIGLVVEYATNVVLATAVSFLALRHFSPDEMGELIRIQTVVGLLAVLMTLSLDAPLINRLTAVAERGALLGTALALRAGASVLTFGVALGLAAALGQSPAQVLPWLGIVLLPQLLIAVNLFGVMLYYDNQMARVAQLRIVLAFVLTGVRLAMLFVFDASLWEYTLVSVGEAALGFALGWWVYRAQAYPIRFSVRGEVARALLKDAVPLVLSAFIVTCFFKLEMLLVAKVVSPAMLAEYSVAQRIVECYLVVVMILLNQHYLWLTSQSRTDRIAGIANMARTGVGLVLAAAAAHFLLTQPLLNWFFAEKYAQGIELSGLLLLSVLVSVLGAVRGYLFIFEGLNKWHVPSALMGIGVVLAATSWATMHYGLYGAAWVLILGQVISAVVSTWIFAPLRGYSGTLLGFHQRRL